MFKNYRDALSAKAKADELERIGNEKLKAMTHEEALEQLFEFTIPELVQAVEIRTAIANFQSEYPIEVVIPEGNPKDRTYRRERFKTRSEAEQYAAQFEGAWVDPEANLVTLLES